MILSYNFCYSFSCDILHLIYAYLSLIDKGRINTIYMIDEFQIFSYVIKSEFNRITMNIKYINVFGNAVFNFLREKLSHNIINLKFGILSLHLVRIR